MLNSIETYRNAGAIAGKAMRRGDKTLAMNQNRWLSRACALEKPEDLETARTAYNEAYREESGFFGLPSPE
jgi:hypothetical protein